MHDSDKPVSPLTTLLQACSDLQRQLCAGLPQLQRDPHDSAAANAIFRSLQTVKGSAGHFDFVEIVAFAHTVESVLMLARDQQQAPDADHVELLLATGGFIGMMLTKLLACRASLSPEEQRNAATIETWLRHLQNEVPAMLPEPALPAAADLQLRVQADKVDALIDLVGDLVVASAGAQMLAQQPDHGSLLAASQRVNELVEQVRERTLQLRMVEIGGCFSRLQQACSQLGSEQGKPLRLECSGSTTELDRTVAERLGEPLLQLLRNAVEHGIETQAERLAAGKPAVGRLRLSARHDGSHIVIELADDGAGLPAAHIRTLAVERGLVFANSVLSEHEIRQLIFEPGFTTAGPADDGRARGMGMESVRSAVEAMRGAIEIDSQSGQGTSIRIRLPLALSIISGFLVSVGDAAFVLPLDSVIECVELPDPAPEKGFLPLRGEALPLLDLRQLFEIPAAATRRRSVVVVRTATSRAGVMVDCLHGEQQTVIKPMSKLFGSLHGISGSSILGSGEVALVLDIAALVAESGRLAQTGTSGAGHIAR